MKDQSATLSALKKARYNQTYAASLLGVSLQTVTRRVAALRAAGEKIPTFHRTPATAPAQDPVDELKRERARREALEKQLAAEREAKCPVRLRPATRAKRGRELIRVVIPDSHGCFIDEAAAGAFLADLRSIDPDEIVMLGDHVDCSGFLAEHFVLGATVEATYSYEDDIAAANRFLDEIQKAAPRARIHYLEGNHEARVERWCVTHSLRHAKDAEALRNLYAPDARLALGRRGITFYRRSARHMDLPIPGTIQLGKCFFAHDGKGEHAAAGMVRRFGAPVVFGHIHRQQAIMVRTVASGVIGAWCPGCLCQLQPTYGHVTISDWSHGYGLQTVLPSGVFQHTNALILDGVSLLPRVAA